MSAHATQLQLAAARAARAALVPALVLAAAALTGGCAALRYDVPRLPSSALADPLQTPLGRSFAAQLSSSPGMSGFRLLPSGQEAFIARAALAEAAQRTLDLQYHIVAADATGTALIYRAWRAAQRGVRVRLLIDDLDVGDRDADLGALAAHPNVQVRVFNPFAWRSSISVARALDYLAFGLHLNQRMHNKLWIADNAAALIGGRNLGDAYFDADGQSNFADLDVLAAGPVVAEASRSFDEYWNSEWAIPIQAFTGPAGESARSKQLLADMATRVAAFREGAYVRELMATGLGPQVRSGRIELTAAHAVLLHDPPAKLRLRSTDESGHLLAGLREAIRAAREELVLITPYFVPSGQGVEVLCGLARRGVSVRVLTNSLASTDVAAVHAGYARHRPRLLACGVVLHELRPRVQGSGRLRRVLSSGVSLHAKAIMIDRSSVLIGSMNLDPRSRQSNTEVAVLIDSAPLGRELGLWFDEAAAPDHSFRPVLTEPGNPDAALAWTGREDEQPQRYDGEPLASWWQRLVSRVLGVLIPEELL